MKSLAVTGGMGSGKSLAVHFLNELGATTFDADRIGHAVVNEESVRKKIVERYGPEMVCGKGTVDRMALAEKVFGNQAELIWLENLVHPRVRSILLNKIRDSETGGKTELLAAEIPLLIETSMEDLFDYTLLIVADEERRIARCLRKNLKKEEIRNRMSRQILPEEAIKKVDCVIENNGSRKMLKEEIVRFWNHLSLTS